MNFQHWAEYQPEEVTFAIVERNGRPTVILHYGGSAKALALVTPPAVTNWPRVTGDGDFGTMFGPAEVTKAKFTLDLADAEINGEKNKYFDAFRSFIEHVDDRLLDFVQANQLRLLGRKNLNRDEVKMLQIRTVRPKYDKATGLLSGHSMQLSVRKFGFDGMGGTREHKINVCDKDGQVVADGSVRPGDVVAATAYVNQVYTGVGGDKFGIHWSFEDVQVLCQRNSMAPKSAIPNFGMAPPYEFAQPYAQFPEVYA